MFSYPDRVGVGYGLSSLRDFTLPELGNIKFEIQNLKSKTEFATDQISAGNPNLSNFRVDTNSPTRLIGSALRSVYS